MILIEFVWKAVLCKRRCSLRPIELGILVAESILEFLAFFMQEDEEIFVE